MSYVMKRLENILQRLAGVKRAQASQAVRSRIDHQPSQVEDNVAVPILLVDRGRGDPVNFLGLISCHNPEKVLYKISVRDGVLKGHFSRNQFQLCPQKLLTEADVRQDQALSIRKAVTKQSRWGDKDSQNAIVEPKGIKLIGVSGLRQK